MSSDDELWNSGENSVSEDIPDEDNALDLSSPSPEVNEDLKLKKQRNNRE